LLTGLVDVIAEHGSKHVLRAVIAVWVILAVVGLGTAVVSRYRNMSAQVRATRTCDRQ
jgi:Flp pilus assembly pilin Flp